MKEYMKGLFCCTMVLAVMAVPATGQEQLGLRERAEALYQKFEYASAASLYAKLANRKHPKLADVERLAQCYERMKEYEAAEEWYARVVKMEGSEPENVMHYGEVLKMNGKYQAAKKQLTLYATQTNNHEDVAVLLAGCDSALRWMNDPTAHKLQNQAINTPLSEFSVFPMGKEVYYTGEPTSPKRRGRKHGWTGNSFLRVYKADRAVDNELSNGAIAELSMNNTAYHVGPVAADAQGKTLYVTRTYPGKNGTRTQEGKTKYLTSRLELYIYTRGEDGSWESEPFAYNNVDAYSLGHATVDTTGNVLYFVSDMPGGEGGADIWYSERQTDGSWGAPVNAGSTINSAGDELFPNMGPGNRLYYASDGFAGMGGLDVFEAVGNKQQWTNPRNLRFPVNSSRDDFGYLPTENSDSGISGYLSSNRMDGKGGDDIYSFTYKKQPIIVALRGTTSDKKTGDRLVSSRVVLSDGNGEVVAKQSSNGQGMFEFVLERDKLYKVTGQREKYHADTVGFNTHGITKSDTIDVALLLDPVFEVGESFVLENIHYDFDQHNIRPDAAGILKELARTLRDHPTLKIELSSHTDSRGSRAYNLSLSQRRATAAVEYLVNCGIARDRMVAEGYGETRPLNKCSDGVSCTAEQHQANRRTEIKILAY